MNSDHESNDDRSDGLRAQTPQDDELLSAYIDGELTGPELARVELRLQQDAEARRWVSELRTLASLVKSLPHGRLDPNLRAQVLRQINERRLSSVAQPSVSLAPSLAGAAYGSLRRWLWSGLAIAAVLLLMFLQSGQPEAERHVADAEPGSGQEKRVNENRAKEMVESERMGRMVDHGREAESGPLTALPSAAGRGAQGTSMGESSAGKLSVLPAPAVAAARLSKDSLASGAKGTGENSPESYGFARATGERSPPQAGLRGRSEAKRGARRARHQRAGSYQAEPDLVVQVVLHGPQRDRQWFRHWLTEQGIEPLEQSDSPPMAGALSEGLEQQGRKRQIAGRRPPSTYPGELMETVIVETLPEQLRGLLQTCRTDPELQATMGWMSPEGDSLARSPDWDAPDAAGAEHENRLANQRADVGPRRSSLGDAAGTPQMPVRVRFELRVAVPGRRGGKAESARPVE